MKKSVFCIFFICIALAIVLFPSNMFAETPTENSPDIGAYEHGYRTSTALIFPEENYDGDVYGENNTNHIYVSTSGSDAAGDGTEMNPYATITAAVKNAAPGTTVHVAAGVYNITEIINIPVGVSIEGAVPCGDSWGVRTAQMTVLTSVNLTREFSDVILSLHSELFNGYEKTDGNQHISNLFFDGQGTAAEAIEVENRSNVSIHDCSVIDFARIGVGWRIEDYMDGGDGEPIPNNPPVKWATGGRFFNNYMKDNSFYGPDEWGSYYGRGALFCCGLKDFRIYNNTIIEDCRTAPEDHNGARIRGVPVKFWYFNSWMLGCKIHDNTIQKLGSTVHSSDGDGWDFAIESCSHVGMEIYNNSFIGAVDLNAGMSGTFDGTNYEYASWIHDNSFSADPNVKIDHSDYEEWAIVLERITQKTIIERNTAADCNSFIYFNTRDSVTDVDIRYNVCTDMSPNGGTMIRLDGIAQSGAQNPMVVSNLNIYNNILQTRSSDNAGFAIFLGQQMDAWRGENITIANNIISDPGYGSGIDVGNHNTLSDMDGLYIENNLFHHVATMRNLNYSGSADAVVADNIMATDSQWADAFASSGWHPAENSVLIDAGKNMGADTDAWNNRVNSSTVQPPVPVDYTITEGADSQWTKGGDTGLLIVSDAAFSKFDNVQVDGKTIAVSDYTAEEGPTKITLLPSYLETLSIGEHSVKVVSEDGSATANITIKAAEQPPVPVSCIVAFHMNGFGTQIAAESVADGNKVTKPEDPVENGYTFKGWYTDSTLQTAFNFDTVICADTTLYAKWEEDSVSTCEPDSVLTYEPDTVKNGDFSHMLFWVIPVLIAGSLLLIGIAIYTRKKTK